MAAVFNVSTEADLVAAINAANSNGQPNTINITAPITLTGFLPPLGASATDKLTIDLNGNVISGGGVTRVFFANAGTIEILNGAIDNGLAKGGDGGQDSSPGGGGMGAGGALFVRAGVSVTVDMVSFADNRAQGATEGTPPQAALTVAPAVVDLGALAAAKGTRLAETRMAAMAAAALFRAAPMGVGPRALMGAGRTVVLAARWEWLATAAATCRAAAAAVVHRPGRPVAQAVTVVLAVAAAAALSATLPAAQVVTAAMAAAAVAVAATRFPQ